MAGIDAQTGRALTGWPHVVQSVWIILTTGLGTRPMRRYVGAVTAALLGRLINPKNMLRLMQSVVVALDLYEPRFKVRRITPVHVDRAGRAKILIEGEYRPRGHLGDPTPESVRTMTLDFGDGGAGITLQ